jgi:DNA polymerase-1
MHLLLVDGSGYIFRAFHALPPLSRKSDGLPVGCVQGFCNMLFKLTQDLEGAETPTHMAVIFDAKGKTFRDAIYDQYKAQRPPAPEELVPQFPLTRAPFPSPPSKWRAGRPTTSWRPMPAWPSKPASR